MDFYMYLFTNFTFLKINLHIQDKTAGRKVAGLFRSVSRFSVFGNKRSLRSGMIPYKVSSQKKAKKSAQNLNVYSTSHYA